MKSLGQSGDKYSIILFSTSSNISGSAVQPGIPSQSFFILVASSFVAVTNFSALPRASFRGSMRPSVWSFFCGKKCCKFGPN